MIQYNDYASEVMSFSSLLMLNMNQSASAFILIHCKYVFVCVWLRIEEEMLFLSYGHDRLPRKSHRIIPVLCRCGGRRHERDGPRLPRPCHEQQQQSPLHTHQRRPVSLIILCLFVILYLSSYYHGKQPIVLFSSDNIFPLSLILWKSWYIARKVTMTACYFGCIFYLTLSFSMWS